MISKKAPVLIWTNVRVENRGRKSWRGESKKKKTKKKANKSNEHE